MKRILRFGLLSWLAFGCDAGSSSTNGEGGAAVALGGTSGHSGGATNGGATSGKLRDYLGATEFPDSFWQVGTAEETRLDTARLESAVTLIERSGWEIHSFLVARNGKLAFERYGWSTGTNVGDPDKTPRQVLPNERHAQFSTTKSVLSALIGIALHEGAITSLDQKAIEWFPDAASLNPSPDKELITLEHLLTMRSGLKFMEGEQATFQAPDPARAMLARDVVDLPVGTKWNYSSGGSDILAEILRVATQQTPLAYANAKLFGPLGISDPPWIAGQNGTNHGGWGLSLTTREMARFGELFRNNGRWQNQSIVPAAWTDTSTIPRCPTSWGGEYAYHWWVPPLPGFINTLGSFGQVIYISRERGLVVVFTANLPNETANSIFQQLIRDYVVPAAL